jgi:hypothetical protein
MKKALKIASVLTWFNLIFWGLLVCFGLLGALLMGQMPLLAGIVLLSAIPLNCFAALKLHTSIRYSAVPLNRQTPVGIRFVGLMALFFGITDIFTGVSIVAQVPEEQRVFYTAMARKAFVEFMGVATLVLGLLVVINVVLNLRLLRWYYLVNRSDVS